MSQQTIDHLARKLRLINEIEEAEAELEEQKDLILKFKLDEEQEGTDMSAQIRYARAELQRIKLRIRELRCELEEIESTEEDGDVLITIGDQALSVPILSLDALS